MPDEETYQALAEAILEQRKHAELFRYMAKVELSHSCETPMIRDCLYCYLASDGKPFWGQTFEEAVTKCMEYDKAALFFP